MLGVLLPLSSQQFTQGIIIRSTYGPFKHARCRDENCWYTPTTSERLLLPLTRRFRTGTLVSWSTSIDDGIHSIGLKKAAHLVEVQDIRVLDYWRPRIHGADFMPPTFQRHTQCSAHFTRRAC